MGSPSEGWTASSGPDRVRMLGSWLRLDGEVWTTTNTEAGKSARSPGSTCTNAWTAPAEPPMATMSRRRAFPPCRAAPPPGEPPPPAPGSGTFEAHENGPVPGAALLEHPRRHLPGSILPAIRLEPEIFDRLSVREH